jgi:hypothetical protein
VLEVSRIARSTALVVAALTLVLSAACRQEASPGASTLSIQSPEGGAAVSSPVQLDVSVDGAQIGPPETGEMHLHVYVGDSSDYAVVTSTEASVPVPQGDQTIRVVLANPNHDETGISDSVSITVSGGQSPAGGGGGYGDGGGGGGSGGGYGY